MRFFKEGKKIKKAAILFVLIVVAAVLFDIGRFFFYPDISLLKKTPVKTSFMEYREGLWRKEGKRRKIQQAWVPLSRVSPYIKKAVVIAEDGEFWSHEGFDFEAMEEALLKNIREGRIKAGGSTITQQLAKNLYLDPRKTPARKLKEGIIAWRLEREFSKKEILELYLNVAEWGDGIFGVEAASRRYFGKSSSELTPEEAARLVVVLPNPRRWSPVGNSRYVERRSRAVYRTMVRRGIVPVVQSVAVVEEGGQAPAEALLEKTSADSGAVESTGKEVLPVAPGEI